MVDQGLAMTNDPVDKQSELFLCLDRFGEATTS